MSGDAAKAHFGVLLRTLRERAGLTQQELAERADLSPHAISSLERGSRGRPYPHTVRSLADALGIPDSERAALIAAVPRRRAAGKPVTRPAGLAIPPTPLYGRDDDVASVVDLVRSGARLVTLTGPGGVGKTRLTAAVADVLADEYRDGVVQVSLAPLADASALMATIGRALGLAGIDGSGAFDLVAAQLRASCLLLVLDNFEHLLSAAAQVGQLTALCPDLTVLASSRSPLRVRVEREYVVEPLELPASNCATLDELRANPAGALALDRAESAGVRPAAPDVPAYAELCHRLAGLPLAIELAIAQLRLLSPAALLDRLETATARSGARDLPERQRTMRATLDWSYGLLDPDQQRLFTLLGAFRGGATLEAVEAVAEAGDGIAAGEVLGVLHELAEHSLIRVRSDRVQLLEPVAQYARSLLVGDRAARIARAHARVYLDLAEQAAAGYERADQVEWLERIEEEEANLLVAVERSLDAGDAPTAARITWFMWLYWWMRGQFTIGRRLAEQCLAPDLPPWEQARVNLAAATMTYAAGDQAAAASYWAEADRIAAGQDDPEVRSKARAGTGLAALASGDLDAAENRFRAALNFAADDRSSTWMASLVHVWLGTVHLLRGDPAAAVPELESGLDLARVRGDRLATYVALYNLSQVALALGDYTLARQRVEDGIALSQETRDLANLAYFIETLAVIESQEGNHLRVATLLGAATGLRETVGADIYAFFLPDPSLRGAAEAAARAALGDAAYDEAVATGRSLDASAAATLA
ncbi:putative ATPase [Kribbella antiqua]|uniref:Putative ATPase n=1 Tax=Kribbella antiqua TaxID=2512217 RepID=A0A4R2IEB2_9ACTN|nr:helix-turn-helix domain-containing protein [Kribbella antiqua]TCO42526.1 putative ATPase [Kribbella antiqua]